MPKNWQSDRSSAVTRVEYLLTRIRLMTIDNQYEDGPSESPLSSQVQSYLNLAALGLDRAGNIAIQAPKRALVFLSLGAAILCWLASSNSLRSGSDVAILRRA